jgi:hypothetical protein
MCRQEVAVLLVCWDSHSANQHLLDLETYLHLPGGPFGRHLHLVLLLI